MLPYQYCKLPLVVIVLCILTSLCLTVPIVTIRRELVWNRLYILELEDHKDHSTQWRII